MQSATQPITKKIMLAHAATAPPRGYALEIIEGKKGRVSDTKPPHCMFAALLKTVPTETYADEVAAADTALASRVISEAVHLHRASGHRFDNEYMAANDGAYGINVVVINEKLEVSSYIAPLFRPTSSSGHSFLKDRVAVWALIQRIYPDLKETDASTTESFCGVSKFQDLDVLLVTPMRSGTPNTGILTAELAHKLRLQPKGDGSDTTVVLRTRLCDCGGMARSPPKLSLPKFRFLFPDGPVDFTIKKPKAKKRAALTNDPDDHDEAISDADDADDNEKVMRVHKCVRFETPPLKLAGAIGASTVTATDSSDAAWENAPMTDVHAVMQKLLTDQTMRYCGPTGFDSSNFKRVSKYLHAYMATLGKETFGQTFAHFAAPAHKINLTNTLCDARLMEQLVRERTDNPAHIDAIMSAVHA